MALYTTQAPDGNSFVPLENWVFDTICSKLGEKAVGDRDPGGIGQIEGFLWQAAGKLSSWEKYDPGNAAKVRESWGQEHTEGELLGKVGLAQGAAFLIHLIFHELKTPFHTSTHWKTFHLENTCSSLSDHSSWWFWFLFPWKRILHLKHL